MISYDIGCRILGKTSTIYYCCRPLDVLTRKCEGMHHNKLFYNECKNEQISWEMYHTLSFLY